jgi:signal peptidase I
MDESLKQYEMTTNSMYPMLKAGDFLLVREISAGEELHIGDCLLYEAKEKSFSANPVCHRLVKIQDNELYLKGDDTLMMDKPVTRAVILGRVIAVKKAGKIIFLNSSFQGIRARAVAYLSLFSLRIRFLGRLGRLLYYSPQEIRGHFINKFRPNQ